MHKEISGTVHSRGGDEFIPPPIYSIFSPYSCITVSPSDTTTEYHTETTTKMSSKINTRDPPFIFTTSPDFFPVNIHNLCLYLLRETSLKLCSESTTLRVAWNIDFKELRSLMIQASFQKRLMSSDHVNLSSTKGTEAYSGEISALRFWNRDMRLSFHAYLQKRLMPSGYITLPSTIFEGTVPTKSKYYLTTMTSVGLGNAIHDGRVTNFNRPRTTSPANATMVHAHGGKKEGEAYDPSAFKLNSDDAEGDYDHDEEDVCRLVLVDEEKIIAAANNSDDNDKINDEGGNEDNATNDSNDAADDEDNGENRGDEDEGSANSNGAGNDEGEEDTDGDGGGADGDDVLLARIIIEKADELNREILNIHPIRHIEFRAEEELLVLNLDIIHGVYLYEGYTENDRILVLAQYYRQAQVARDAAPLPVPVVPPQEVGVADSGDNAYMALARNIIYRAEQMCLEMLCIHPVLNKELRAEVDARERNLAITHGVREFEGCSVENRIRLLAAANTAARVRNNADPPMDIVLDVAPLLPNQYLGQVDVNMEISQDSEEGSDESTARSREREE